MKAINNLDMAIDISIHCNESVYYNADFKLNIENEEWTCYGVSIATRDILCFCKEGSATLLVDTYGKRSAAMLHDWNSV